MIGTRFYIFGGSVGDNVNRYETVNDFYYCDVGTARTHTHRTRATAHAHTRGQWLIKCAIPLRSHVSVDEARG